MEIKPNPRIYLGRLCRHFVFLGTIPDAKSQCFRACFAQKRFQPLNIGQNTNISSMGQSSPCLKQAFNVNGIIFCRIGRVVFMVKDLDSKRYFCNQGNWTGKIVRGINPFGTPNCNDNQCHYCVQKIMQLLQPTPAAIRQ